MGSNLGTNAMTYYLILPILVIVAGVIVWLIAREHVSPWKRVRLIAGGIFAFFGFVVAVGLVYYHFNMAFAGSFRFYAYSVLAPTQGQLEAQDPFQAPDGYYGSILTLQEVYKKDGQVYVARSVTPGFGDYGAYIFTPGKWIVANQTNDIVTVRQPGQYFSDPGITKMSLWWALTKDLYKLESSVE